MCWGIYLAIPNGMQPPQPPDDDSLTGDNPIHAWHVGNPWIQLAFGDAYSCWILGHARHCSCGCVNSDSNQSTATLAWDARQYIADLADAVGHIGIAMHWTSGAYASEKLPFDVADSIFSDRLRTESVDHYTTDVFYWIQGRGTSAGSAEQ